MYVCASGRPAAASADRGMGEATRRERRVPQYDLPLDELRAYEPALPVPPDLEAFWTETLAEARERPLSAVFEPIDSGLVVAQTFDVTFAGFGGAPIRAWLHLPVGRPRPLPAIVEYIGYGGGRGLPHERNLWALAGYAHFVMDTRGQGSGWAVGDTPDPGSGGDPSHQGWMTDGILDPRRYYYRRVFTDAVRAVEAVRSHPAVDPARVAVLGGSQGGGITIAAAALVPDLAAAAPDVPFLCCFPRALTFSDKDPYGEVVRYLKAHRNHVETAERTLSYFDGAVLGRLAKVPALFSVALMDMTCPPSTVYAAYNAYGGPKEICEYPYNEHEGGQGFHDATKLRWLAARLHP